MHARFFETLIAQERETAQTEHRDALSEVDESVGEILLQPSMLTDKIVVAVDDCTDTAGGRTAVFLYRVGAFYLAYRTLTMLDDLSGRLSLPVTRLYPSGLVGRYGLRFMN